MVSCDGGADMEENRKQENRQALFRNAGVVLLIFVIFVITRFGINWLAMKDNRIWKNYSAPVLPMNIISSAEGIVAEREVVMDFAAYKDVAEKPDTAIEKVKITDKYQLTNTTDTDIVVKAVYPFTEFYGIHLKKCLSCL